MVEGIEAMRFVFGVDNLSDTGAAVDYSQPVQWASALNRNSPTNRGDGAPDTTCTSSTPCSLADLTNTADGYVAVRLLGGGEFPGWAYFASSLTTAALWPTCTVLLLWPQVKAAADEEQY